jgi:hypothetical protein
MNEPMDESNNPELTDEFERKLANALRRVDAPSTMQQFLLRAAEVKQESRLPWRERKHRWAFYMPRLPVWAAGALTMVVAGSIFGGAEYRQRLEHERITSSSRSRSRSRLSPTPASNCSRPASISINKQSHANTWRLR